MMFSNSPPQQTLGKAKRGFWGSLIAVLIVISPKCPLCWAAYLSFLGISGGTALSLGPWVVPILSVLFLIHLGAMVKQAIQEKSFLPLTFSLIGFICILTGYFQELQILKLSGVLLILAGSITGALSMKSKTSCCCNSK